MTPAVFAEPPAGGAVGAAGGQLALR
ncbi:MAG: hypothetical protein JWO66_2909, partial [Candidatus Eremiobacteraeota bacterium]|nr:hypothetical protein [Candidatus Eremiobacteraeota bacterium]